MHKSILRLLTLELILLSSFLNAQTIIPNRGCGTDIPPLLYEMWVQSLTPKQGKTNGGQTQSIFNIPVIVHVIHNNEPLNSPTATSGGNLNAAQIIDQINILNKDFNGTNPDTALIPAVFKPVQGKFQFNFCLAVVNPTGGILAEPGIDRINRVAAGWTSPPFARAYIDGTIKPATIWDPTRYLNMWVCGISGSILGYATFPNPGASGLQGLTPPYGSMTTDGLVMRNSSFGSIGTAVGGAPYHLGRTATHEIGHWLGLRHIWGDNGQCGGSDFCNDTPPQRGGTNSPAGSNYGCPTFPLNANTCTLSGQSNVNGDMFMNYMDYTNDACMYMFTKDQKNRAQLIMTNSPMRATLLTSTVCNLPTTQNEIGILYVSSPTYSQTLNCVTQITPSIVVKNFGSNAITSATFTYNLNGQGTFTMPFTGNIPANSTTTLSMPVITGISNGAHNYNVGVFNPNGSTDPNMVNNVNNQQFSTAGNLTVTSSGNTSVCFGGVATLTANSTATNYVWTPGNLIGSAVTVSPAVNTIYTVNASNGICVSSKTVQVNVVSSASICVNSLTSCAGNPVVLNACGGLTYTLQPGALNGQNFTVNPLSTTVYTVLGTAAGGCTGTATGTVSVTPLPTISFSVSPTGSICSGSSASIVPNGACSYTFIGFPISNSIVVSPTVTSTYTVVGASCNGCLTTKTVSVPVNSAPNNVSVTASQTNICTGSNVTLTASGAITYSWNTGATANLIVVSPSVTTTYSVIGSNGTCNSQKTISVQVTPLPIVSVNNQTICPGGTTTLSASGANSYSWSNGATSSSISVNPASNTIYTVTGSNSLNCTNSRTVSVFIGTGLSLSILSSPSIACANQTVLLSAFGANTYTWSNGFIGSSITVTPSVANNFSVIGSANTCTGSSSILVPIVSPPNVSLNVSPSATLCSPSSLTIHATGASSYSWSNGSNTASTVVSPSASTVYSLTAFNGNCKLDTTIQVYFNLAPTFSVNASPSFSVCSGQSLTLTANGNYSNYLWQPLNQNAGSVVINPSVTTLYTVTASGNVGGCVAFKTITINVYSGSVISSLSVTTSGCGTNCIGAVNATTSGGQMPYTYSLSVSGCTSLPCNNLCPGLYTLFTKDSLGCSSYNIFSIESLKNNLTAVAQNTGVSCATCSDGIAEVLTFGGLAPYSYTWNPSGGNSIVANNLPIGCYTIQISDAAGCNTSARTCVNVITNIDELESNRLAIYPNPASNKVEVVMQNEIFDITIHNALGQLIYLQKQNIHHTTFSVSNLPKGVYTISIETEKSNFQRKLIVE